ncbi:MAG: hypothetical protein B7Z79_11390 [Thiomonas sp. 20-64-9]|nr:MAG: hypothetical protein B7Z79_11390 [Thiomonas sp. 20-64-9]
MSIILHRDGLHELHRGTAGGEQVIKGSLGGGAFEYEGAMAGDRSGLTVWRMSLYGAVVAGHGNGAGREERYSVAHCLTAPLDWRVTKELLRMLGD